MSRHWKWLWPLLGQKKVAFEGRFADWWLACTLLSSGWMNIKAYCCSLSLCSSEQTVFQMWSLSKIRGGFISPFASGRHQMRIVQEKRKQSQPTPSARQHWKTSSKSVTETGVGPKSNSESPPLQFDLHCIVCKLIQKLYKFLDTEVNNLWEYFSSFIW